MNLKESLWKQKARDKTWCFRQIKDLQEIIAKCRKDNWSRAMINPYEKELGKLFNEIKGYKNRHKESSGKKQ